MKRRVIAALVVAGVIVGGAALGHSPAHHSAGGLSRHSVTKLAGGYSRH